MDLNELFHRQQVERSLAQSARTEAARKAHEELAVRYEEQIEAMTAAGFSFSAVDSGEPGAGQTPDKIDRESLIPNAWSA